MDKTLHSNLLMRSQRNPIPLTRGMGWGGLGGLTGTLAMDLLLMGALSIFGLPALTCFSIVGDTVSRFFEQFGAQVAGGVPAGVMTHYVVGPLFGVLFGAAVTKLHILRGGSLKKITIAAFVYVEILSQPILVTTPILLKMGRFTTLQWYCGAFIMHLIMSVVLGIIVGYGLRPAPIATQRRAQ